MVIGPAVVTASQSNFSTLGFGDHWGTSVTTGIVKGIDVTRFAVHDDDGLASIFPKYETSRFRDFVDMGSQQPALSPKVLVFKGHKSGVGVSAAG
jgi:hypothetical protein